MSIKSDNWIKKMSTENDMISPFQPNQVKINEDSRYNSDIYKKNYRSMTYTQATNHVNIYFP